MKDAPHPTHKSFGTEKPMEGLTFVAPPRVFPENPMPSINKVGADWIAVIPYGFTRIGDPTVYYGSDRQWWGERVEGVKETLRLAEEHNIKVMLKPQVYVPGGWTGELDFEREGNWQSWEEGYEQYILLMAEIAETEKVALFCVGTEFKIGAQKREAFWRALIEKIRAVYTGKLVYAANWDAYPLIPFWDALDYVGINAYFPLLPETTPRVENLKKAWQPTFEEIKNFQKKVDRPIIFTEFGYLSVDGCAYNTWELEAKVKSLPINEQAQANAYQALFETFWKEDWWQGGFLWKWFPNMEGGEGYNAHDYTPQGKMGQETLKEWYSN
ncbi:MAG: hypothetical protein AAF599_08740 [Bacteroidota bacterium]